MTQSSDGAYKGALKMVSTWWLAWSFLAGGFTGFMLFAMVAMARHSAESQARAMVHRRDALKSGAPTA